MGSFSNQPDFGSVINVITAFPATAPTPSVLYIGTVTTPATITVTCVDGTTATFSSITSGFFPILVTKVVSAVGIVPADVIFVA